MYNHEELLMSYIMSKRSKKLKQFIEWFFFRKKGFQMDKERWAVIFPKIILSKKLWNEFAVFSNFRFKSSFSKNLFHPYKVSHLIKPPSSLIKGRSYPIKNKKYCDKDIIRYIWNEWKFVEFPQHPSKKEKHKKLWRHF